MGCFESACRPVHQPHPCHRPCGGYAYEQPCHGVSYSHGYGGPAYSAPGYGGPAYGAPVYGQQCYGGQPVYAQPAYGYCEPQRPGISPGMAAAGAGVAGLIGGAMLAEAFD